MSGIGRPGLPFSWSMCGPASTSRFWRLPSQNCKFSHVTYSYSLRAFRFGDFADTHLQNQNFHLTNIPVKRGVELPDVFAIGIRSLFQSTSISSVFSL